MFSTLYQIPSRNVVDPKLFFSDPDPTLTLISDPDSDPDSNPDTACLWKIHKKFRWSKHCKKARLFRKINLNCRSSKHCKKANFFSNLNIFTALYSLVGSRTYSNLDPDPNPDPKLITDPDPNLQIISDPAGSGCTTLPSRSDGLEICLYTLTRWNFSP
jgi:hypothetical protein